MAISSFFLRSRLAIFLCSFIQNGECAWKSNHNLAGSD
jgi:hypothetical protein